MHRSMNKTTEGEVTNYIPIKLIGRRDGLIVSAVGVPGSSGPGSSPGWGSVCRVLRQGT